MGLQTDLLVEIAKQVPSIVALIWIVARFLSHIAQIEKARETLELQKTAALTAVAEKCGIKLDDAAKALGAHSSAMSQIGSTARRLERVADKMDTAHNIPPIKDKSP